MNRNVLKVLVLAVVFLSGVYIVKKDRDNAASVDTSTTETITETPTIAEPSITQRTTIPSNPYALPECLTLKTPCRRDRCHFGNALNRNSTLLCEQIVDSMLRSICLEKLNNARPLEAAVIEGQVFNPADCGVYAGLPVEIRDETNNVTMTAKTNSTGEYGVEVTQEGKYGVYLSVDGTLLNQNITVGGAGRHVVDFALS